MDWIKLSLTTRNNVSFMEQSKEYHINNSTIKIVFGNILNSQAEVIVSSDDCNITMGGGVSWAIDRKKEPMPLVMT